MTVELAPAAAERLAWLAKSLAISPGDQDDRGRDRFRDYHDRAARGRRSGARGPRAGGMSDDALAAAIERARERKVEEAADALMHSCTALGASCANRGVRDDKIPDLLKRIPELRRQDESRGRTWENIGQTQAQRIATKLHAESQALKRGRSM